MYSLSRVTAKCVVKEILVVEEYNNIHENVFEKLKKKKQKKNSAAATVISA